MVKYRYDRAAGTVKHALGCQRLALFEFAFLTVSDGEDSVRIDFDVVRKRHGFLHRSEFAALDDLDLAALFDDFFDSESGDHGRGKKPENQAGLNRIHSLPSITESSHMRKEQYDGVFQSKNIAPWGERSMQESLSNT